MMSAIMWKVVCFAAVVALQGCACSSILKQAETGVLPGPGAFHSDQVEPGTAGGERRLCEPCQVEDDTMSVAMSRLNRRNTYKNHVTVKTDIMEPEKFIQSLLKLARDITAAYMEISLPQLGLDQKRTLNRIIQDSYKNVLGAPDSILRR